MAEWVKLYTNYDGDPAIASGDDSAEVMFIRAIAYCGRARTGGFIPDAQLHHLTRHPARAKRIVGQLTKTTFGEPGPLERVQGGYRIRNWQHYQDQLDALEERRKNDRERKRRQRQKPGTTRNDGPGVTGQSRDGHAHVTPTEKSKSRSAAAAADGLAAAAPVENAPGTADLPPAVEILRAALEAARLVVRWDRLTPDHLADIGALVELHGDGPLVKAAIASHRPDKPAVFAQAWIGAWKTLPAPGATLRVVAPPCPEPGHSGTTDHCTQCASERLSVPDEEAASRKRRNRS